METPEECTTFGSCPFAYTDKSEQAQNYGCLPTPQEIVNMRTDHDKTWACHSNPTMPCLGAIRALKKKGLDNKVIDKELLTEKSNWNFYCGKKPQTKEDLI